MEHSRTDLSQNQEKSKDLDQLEKRIQAMREHIKNQKNEYTRSDNQNR